MRSCRGDRRATSPEQSEFLDQAVAGLAQDGWIVPVRLALFAEMVKGKPWSPATLREVGGMDGVGVPVPGRDLQLGAIQPRVPISSECRAGGAQGALARDQRRPEGADAARATSSGESAVTTTGRMSFTI